MICVLETPMDLTNLVALADLVLNNKATRNGQTAVCVLNWAGRPLASIIAGEKLYLLGHGSDAEIGDMTPEVLARKLLDAGLPAHVGRIVVGTCHSGEGSYPLCRKLMEEIIKQGAADAGKIALGPGKPAPALVKPPVVGFTGVVVTQEDGATRAKDPAKRAAKKAEYDAIIKSKEQELDLWEPRAARCETGTPAKLINSAMQMKVESNELFQLLYEFNQDVMYDETGGKLYKYKCAP